MKVFTLILSLLIFAGSEAYSKVDCSSFSGQYSEQIAKFTQRNLKDKTIFTGSSSIRMWKNIEKYFPGILYQNFSDSNFFNRGFGGSQICHLILNYKALMLGSSKDQNPKRIVLYSGDNDLGWHRSPQTVLDHYKELIRLLFEAGYTGHIDLIVVKPSPLRIDSEPSFKEIFRKTGELISSHFKDHPKVHVINNFNFFFNEDGSIKRELFLSDRLHLKPRVYWDWAWYLKRNWSRSKK